MYPLKWSGPAWTPEKPQSAEESRHIQTTWRPATSQQRLQLTCKNKSITPLAEIQRLHPHRIACKEKRLINFVINRKSEDAVKHGQHRLAARLVERQQHLRIRVAAKTIARLFQFPAQFAEVVNLAVEDDDYLPCRIAHRLVPERRKIQY